MRQARVVSKLKSPLRWPGGKGRLAAQILPYFPRHRTYTEPFCGGGGMFWAKPRDASAAEILNDLNGDLVTFYKVLATRGRQLARSVEALPYSRAVFNRMRSGRPRRAFDRAKRFWFLNRVNFGGLGAHSFGVRAMARSWVIPNRVLESLDATMERLRGVLLEELDACRLIELYDRPATLHYVDPPYWGTEDLYEVAFTREDHARLARTLRAAQGTWILSYNDCREVREMYAGCYRVRLSARYSLRGNNRAYRDRGRRTELLISNRPLRRR